MDQAEDGRTRANAEGQRQDRHGGKAGIPQQLSDGKPHGFLILDLRFLIGGIDRNRRCVLAGSCGSPVPPANDDERTNAATRREIRNRSSRIPNRKSKI